MKLLLLVLGLMAAIPAAPLPASALQDPQPQGPCHEQVSQETTVTVQDDTGFDGSETAAASNVNKRYVRSAQICTVDPPLIPKNVANLADQTGDESLSEDAPSVDPDANCVEWHPAELVAGTTDTYYSEYCLKWRDCGAERLDDVVSGDIAGEESDGQYRSFLDQLVGFFNGASALAASSGGVDLVASGSVSDFLITRGLGERPHLDALPVFYWCADRDSNFVYDPIDIDSARFAWDLLVSEVYDIPASRSALYTSLQAQLDVYSPEIGLVPKTELGFTYVKWPTWMYLQNPAQDISLFTTNDIDTVRIDLRATLIDVVWSYGEEVLVTCLPEDLLRFNDLLDPIDDVPACHYRFLQSDCQDLTATVRFKIEEKVRSRLSATTGDYPDTPWTDFLGTPTFAELSSTLAEYKVHEIRAVNIPQGMSQAEWVANGQSAGTIPLPQDACNFLAGTS